MSTTEAKFHEQNTTVKTHKNLLGPPQICLKIFAVATTLAASWLVFTSKQTTQIFGMAFDARYSYSPPLKFFAYANAVVCAFSFISLMLVLFLPHLFSNPANYFLFLHDLFMLCLVIGGCGAATAIGYEGKYGNSHAGWAPICDNFTKFCKRVSISVILSYFSMLFYLILVIISASKVKQIQI